MEELQVQEYILEAISLEEIRSALEKNLKPYFKLVKVSIEECPDLTEAPYRLATKGIGGGNTVLVDLGGVPYLIPLADRSKVYDLATVIPKYLGVSDFPEGWYVNGAAAGPWPSQGSNCELVVNLAIGKNGDVQNKSRVALTSKDAQEDMVVKELDAKETRCALLANLCVSGGTGKVLNISCSGRLQGTDKNFTTSIRDALNKEFGSKTVGLGGIFTVDCSKTKIHVMRDFSKKPLLTDDDVNTWLKFFQANPPFLCQSVLVSNDPGLDLRKEHSHGWGIHEGTPEAGHYHYDTLPEEAEYRGIYAVANKIVRIDRPTVTHGIGRD